MLTLTTFYLENWGQKARSKIFAMMPGDGKCQPLLKCESEFSESALGDSAFSESVFGESVFAEWTFDDSTFGESTLG